MWLPTHTSEDWCENNLKSLVLRTLYFSNLLGTLWRDSAVSRLLFANRKCLQGSCLVYLVSIAMCLWQIDTFFSTHLVPFSVKEAISQTHLLKSLWSTQSFQKLLVICAPKREETKCDEGWQWRKIGNYTFSEPESSSTELKNMTSGCVVKGVWM